MASYGDQIETSPSLNGAAISAAVATFVSSWEGPHSDVPRGSHRDLAVPLGGCDLRKCRHFRELLGVGQRSDALRGSNRDFAVP